MMKRKRKLTGLRALYYGLVISLISGAPLRAQLVENLKDDLKIFIDKAAADYSFNGAILVAEGDSILYEDAFGYANFELKVKNKSRTVFNLASLSKHITGAAILLLEEKGLLKTSDTLSKYMPDFPNAGKITIHHLLTHSSGLPNYNNFPDYWSFARKTNTSTGEVVDWIRGKPLEFEPGAKFSYSNSGYAVLAHLIEKLSGEKYGEFLRKHFFQPLGMNSTGEFSREEIVPERSEMYDSSGGKLINAPWYDFSFKSGSGSISSSLVDMHKWYLGLTRGKIISKESADRLFSRYEHGYGYGLGRGSDILHIYYEHEGKSPGVASYIAYFLPRDIFLLVLSNVSTPSVKAMSEKIRSFINRN